MHILDIVENSVTGGANQISILVDVSTRKDVLLIEIKDNGRGMDETMQRDALDPFFTTKGRKRVGLGLPMLAEAARKACGEMRMDSRQGKGTVIRATFGLHHVDRQPVGDMIETMVVLIAGYPEVNFTYKYVQDQEGFAWNTRRIEEQLGDVPRYDPAVADFVRKEIREKLAELKQEFVD